MAESGELSQRTVDRVHLLKDDLDWAPSAFLRLNKLIVGSLVVGATVPAFLKFGPMVWFVPGVVAPVAMRLGNRGARGLVRRRLGKFARGDVDLSKLKDEIDGELLHVRGTVEATDTIPGLLAQDPAVYRRVQVSLGRVQIVHEAAVDFTLTDATGQRVKVLAAGSRLLCPISKRYLIEGDAEERVLAEVRRDHVDQLLRNFGVERFETMGDEFVLRPGDTVDVVGYKTRVVDRDIQERLARDEPFRAALQSGRKLPLLIAVVLAALAGLVGCKSDVARTDPNAVGWLRGQLHAHTGNSDDSDTRPHRVVSWYEEHGFDFLVITDHNYVTDEPSRGDLLVLRGAEMTQNYHRCVPEPPPGNVCLIHVSAWFLDGDAGGFEFPPPFDLSRVALFSRGVDAARARGGLAMINHPNLHFAIDADGLYALAQRGVGFVEVWNQHPRVHNEGDADHPSTEALWDAVLTRGATMWGVATDDAHHYDDARDYALAMGIPAVTGDRGWVYVRARKDAQSIRDALVRGDFYSSTGVVLDRVERAGGALLVAVVDDGGGPYRIRFVGPGGRTLAETEGTLARHTAPDGGYVRAEITDARGRHAWTQPARPVVP